MASSKSKTARPKSGRGEKGADYFFALQVGQVAQVVLPSVQHFMPQEGLAEHSVFFLQQVEQPLMIVTAQKSATNVAMSFMFRFGSLFRPSAQVQTIRFATAASPGAS